MDKSTKKQKIFKILNAIFIVLLSLLLFLNLYNIAGRLIFKKALPKLLGYCDAVVLSGSMSPTIEVGDLIIISEKDSYKIGDIITYENNGLITHRIVDIEEGGYITKGDHNNTADIKTVTSGQVQGKVVMVLPKIGYAVSFFKTPSAIVLIIIVAAILIEMPTIINKIKNKKGGRNREKQ